MRLLDIEGSDLANGHVAMVTEKSLQRDGTTIPYSILSHRWQDEEVTFADVLQDQASTKAGYRRLTSAMRVAQSDGYRFLWSDTCCIDKSSSAELSEAINSMYKWYQDADVCYAYLYDVLPASDQRKIEHHLADSEWFERGWCLQELLAPRNVVFLSSDWQHIGNKTELAAAISRITRIPQTVLEGTQSIFDVSIARRMSWAAHRKTERIEDIAYSLMGLFSVNIPLLYGEGLKAFIRLQEEIMKSGDDMSLFVWKRGKSDSSDDSRGCGLLASSPADFAETGLSTCYHDWYESIPFGMTNKGLNIELGVSRQEDSEHEIAVLPCTPPGGEMGFVSINIRRLREGSRQYVRMNPEHLGITATEGRKQIMLFPQTIQNLESRASTIFHYRLTLDRHPGESFVAKIATTPNDLKLNPENLVASLNQGASTDVFSFPFFRPGLKSVTLFEHVLSDGKTVERFNLFILTTKDLALAFDVEPNIVDVNRRCTASSDRYGFREAAVAGELPAWRSQMRMQQEYHPAAIGATKKIWFHRSSQSSSDYGTLVLVSVKFATVKQFPSNGPRIHDLCIDIRRMENERVTPSAVGVWLKKATFKKSQE